MDTEGDDWGYAGYHVYPTHDVREHELSEDCWCKPVRDEEDPRMLVHNLTLH